MKKQISDAFGTVFAVVVGTLIGCVNCGCATTVDKEIVKTPSVDIDNQYEVTGYGDVTRINKTVCKDDSCGGMNGYGSYGGYGNGMGYGRGGHGYGGSGMPGRIYVTATDQVTVSQMLLEGMPGEGTRIRVPVPMRTQSASGEYFPMEDGITLTRKVDQLDKKVKGKATAKPTKEVK